MRAATPPGDLALAAVLAAGAELEIWAPRFVPGVGDTVADRPFLAVSSLLASLALVLRRRFPLVVLLVVLGTLTLQQLLSTPTEGLVLLVTAMVAAYSASAYAPVRRAAAAGGAVVLGAAFIGGDAGDEAFLAVVLGAAWLLGFVVGRRSEELVRSRADNRDLAQRLAAAADELAEAQRRAASSPTTGELATLTPRELDVVRAVATGQSNAEIAASLVISEWTVKSHVASILRKLGLRDRAQVVVAAYESGLVEPGANRQGFTRGR